MKDKFILGFLIFTMWVLIGTIWFKPSPVNAHDDGHSHRHSKYDYNFKRAVRSIVEDCSVDGEEISC